MNKLNTVKRVPISLVDLIGAMRGGPMFHHHCVNLLVMQHNNPMPVKSQIEGGLDPEPTRGLITLALERDMPDAMIHLTADEAEAIGRWLLEGAEKAREKVGTQPVSIPGVI